MNSSTRAAAARTFLRSLNILLKFTRLYGFVHVRTAEQYKTTWSELQETVAADPTNGFLLGVSGPKLLLDGVPVEGTPAERSFAELLSQAGLASITFSPRVTSDEFAAFVKAFALAGTKAAGLAAQLKSVLGEGPDAGIRINEIRFVAEDSANAGGGIAAQIAAQSLAPEAGQMREWLNDPQKLLQMIVAAEGGHCGGSGAGGGSGNGRGMGTVGGGGMGSGGGRDASACGQGWGAGAGSGGGTGNGGGRGSGGGGGANTGLALEEDVISVVRLLAGMHHASAQPVTNQDAGAVQQEFAQLPASAQDMLRQALASLPKASGKADPTALLKLAEHMAIRFALQRFERGEVKVNAVRQMLDRMGHEIENLRKVLTAHEEKMSKSGVLVESHAEILDRQFWAAVPETGKQAVLMSPEAYCIPPKNVRQYVSELVDKGKLEDAAGILTNYAGCVRNPEADARKRAAMGLSELAELYARTAFALLNAAIRMVGEQVAQESDAEMQTLLGAAFVRMSQEATSRRNYQGMQQALDCIRRVELERPQLAESLRPRIGVVNRLADFIEEGLREAAAPVELIDVLRRVPKVAAEQAAQRFARCERREECRRLTRMMKEVGDAGVSHLRGMLRERPPGEAAGTVGLLTLLDMPAVQQALPGRVREWERPYHDTVVRQIASAGAEERGRLLVDILESLDPLVWSEAIDEVGMSGDASMARALLYFASGEQPSGGGSLIQVKAIEALGRLRASVAAPALRRLVEEKKLFRWVHPNELRVVAAQALANIDPEWAQGFLPKSGLPAEEFGLAPLDATPDTTWMRQRRYTRVQLPQTISSVAETSHGDYKLATQLLSLGGGLAAAETRMTPGSQASLKIHSGMRPLRARVLMRKAGPQRVGFEFVEMDLEERGRLRKLLAGFGKVSAMINLSSMPPKTQPAA